MMYMIISIYEKISFKTYLINTLFHTLTFNVSCLIIVFVK
jgi:hypothetical protein